MAKILIGEDETEALMLYSVFLKIAKHEVVGATSKDEVLNQLKSFNPDLILLDIMLGDDDGREICREIKRNYQKTKIILISALPELLKYYVDCSADAAIEKPFGLKEALDTIDNVLAY